MKNIFNEETWQSGNSLIEFPKDYVVIDLETTGLSPSNCEIIELSAVKISDNSIVDTFSTLLKPESPVSDFIQQLTGITNEMLSTAPKIDDVIYDFLLFMSKNILVGHNINFDINFLRHNCHKILNLNFDNDYVDTLRLSRKLIPDIENYKLGTVSKYFGITPTSEHRALADCMTTNDVFIKLRDLNNVKEKEFLSLFDNIENVLEGKNVLFMGQTSLCERATYDAICKRAGCCLDKMNLTDKIDYAVLGKQTYAKYMRGDYSEKMKRAIELSKQGKLTILSEEKFVRMLGVDISSRKTISHSKHIDTKSMVADTDDFDETHPLFGKTCVFTGVLDMMPRKEAMQAVLNCGGQIGNAVTQKTNYLILGCNDYCQSIKGGKSSKQKKAEEYKLKGLDIEIIDEELFYSMIKD